MSDELSIQFLPPGHPAWQEIAAHLAAAALNILFTLSPQRLIMGGGVLQNDHLLPGVRQHLGTLLNDYLDHPSLQDGFESWLTAPGLGTHSGILGGIALAASALDS
jgi:fructokinase